MTAAQPQRAIILARISDFRPDDDLERLDERQAATVDGQLLSPGARDQLADLRRHVGRLGWRIGPEATHVLVEDDTSAFKRRKIRLPDGRHELRTVRPKFRRAIDMLARGEADGMCALDLDRVCRDPRDLEDLIDVVESSTPRLPVTSKTGSLDLSTDGGITMARVMVAVANKSSRDTARRVSRARQRQADEGRNHGGIRRFGWEADGVTVREDEARVVSEMADAFLAGASLRALARTLNERGVQPVTQRKRPWAADDISRILTSPSNAGLKTHRGVVGVVTADGLRPYDGGGVCDGERQWWVWPGRNGDGHEPIISRDTWQAVKAKLADPTRRTSPGNAPRWLGSGIYLCGHPRCADTGHTMYVRHKSTPSGHSYPAYRCKVHGHASRQATHLDGYVREVLVARLARPDAVELIRATPQVDIADLSRQANAIRGRIGEAKELWQAGVFTKAELTVRVRRLEQELEPIEARLAAASDDVDPLADIAGRDDAAEIWDRLDLARQRAILRRLLTVTVLPAPQGRRPGGDYFDRRFVRLGWRTLTG